MDALDFDSPSPSFMLYLLWAIAILLAIIVVMFFVLFDKLYRIYVSIKEIEVAIEKHRIQ
jgi:hypothetical protein